MNYAGSLRSSPASLKHIVALNRLGVICVGAIECHCRCVYLIYLLDEEALGYQQLHVLQFA